MNFVTLVFIHGAGGSHLSWQLQLHRFKDAQAVDLPGHPEGSGCKTIAAYVDWLEDYVKKHGLRDLVLAGHSMGGAISIEYALRDPKLRGLVLVGTGARLRVRQDITAKILEDYVEASRLVARLSVAPNCDPVVIDRIAKEMLRVRAEVTCGDWMACDGFDRMSDVAKITTPTLVTCGTDDRLTPPKYSQYLHEKIRSSRLVVIPDAGHSVMLEQHKAFNEALEVFLASL